MCFCFVSKCKKTVYFVFVYDADVICCCQWLLLVLQHRMHGRAQHQLLLLELGLHHGLLDHESHRGPLFHRGHSGRLHNMGYLRLLWGARCHGPCLIAPTESHVGRGHSAVAQPGISACENVSCHVAVMVKVGVVTGALVVPVSHPWV